MNFYKDTAPTMKTNTGDKVSVSDVATNSLVIPELVDNGCKNLLELIVRGSWNGNGITTVLNNDGTLTVNGTSSPRGSDPATYVMLTDNFKPPMGNYVISAENANTSGIYVYDDGPWNSVINNTKYFDGNTGCVVYLRIASGVTVNNLIVKPMICTKEAWDISHEFVPYIQYDSYRNIIKNISQTYQVDNLFPGCISTCPTIPIAGINANTWMIIRTYFLNTEGTRKLQIIESASGDRKTRGFNGSWTEWV